MTASDNVNVLANGNAVLLGTEPKEIATDAQGRIIIITPIESLGSCSVLEIAINGSSVGGPLNPASNVDARLGAVNQGVQGSHLEDQKLHNRNTIFQGLKPPRL